MKILPVFAVLLCVSCASAAFSWKRLATKLNAPRHMAFGHGSDGNHLYVAEGGVGSNMPADRSPFCLPSNEGPAASCFGLTGSITRIDVALQTQKRVVFGLPSFANSAAKSSDSSVLTGSFATGPSAMSSVSLFCPSAQTDDSIGDDTPLDTVQSSSRRISPLLFGLTACLDRDSYRLLTEQGADLSLFGKMIQVHQQSDGTYEVRPVADVCNFQFNHGINDSDPTGLLSLRNANGDIEHWIADAAANNVLRLDRSGNFHIEATIPRRRSTLFNQSFSTDPVPTSLAVVRNQIFVGELGGAPYNPGFSRVLTLDRDDQNGYEIYSSGFTGIIDMTHDTDGNLYVLEIVAAGLRLASSQSDFRAGLIRISPNGQRTRLLPCSSSTNCEDLTWAGGLTYRDGNLFISHRTVTPGQGEVVQIPLANLQGSPF